MPPQLPADTFPSQSPAMVPPSVPRLPRSFLPPSPRGNLIDLALALCSAAGLNSLSRVSLGLIQRADRDPSALGTLSLVVGLVAGLRLPGLYLKRPARRADPEAEIITGCLPFLNFGLMALLLVGASVPLMNLISRREAAGQGNGTPFALLVSVVLLAFLTWSGALPARHFPGSANESNAEWLHRV